MTNQWNTTLYIGFTGGLKGRIWQHKEKVIEGFTQKYNIDKLVYFEIYETALEAIEREKQLKRWSRHKKIDLIKIQNPTFRDLDNDL